MVSGIPGPDRGWRHSQIAVSGHATRVLATVAVAVALVAGAVLGKDTATAGSWVTAAQTAIESCNGSAVTVGAAADGWVLQSSAGQNYGGDSVLKLETKSGADARAYVRFGLPAIPAGCQLTSAKLRLYASSYKDGRTLQAFRVAAPWTESALNWTNQPATVGTAVTTPSGSGYREWTVTQMVRDMYAPNANNGFTIRDAVANGNMPQDFHSREKGTDNPPRLVVTFGS
jgi:large repetitive protein